MKARASKDRIAKLVGDELARYATGDDGDAFWWKAPDGTGRSRPSAAARDKDLQVHVAGRVLEAIGIADWHSYPWHSFFDGSAVSLVEEVARRDLLRRQAEAEAREDPYLAIVEGWSSRRR